MGRSQTYRLLTEHCIKQHPDEHIFGWRGLLPQSRSTSSIRSGVTASGDGPNGNATRPIPLVVLRTTPPACDRRAQCRGAYLQQVHDPNERQSGNRPRDRAFTTLARPSDPTLRQTSSDRQCRESQN